MDLHELDAEDPDRRDLAGAVAVLEAARETDRPHLPSVTTRWLRARLHPGWDGDPAVIAVARDHARRVVGVLEVGLPRWDNRHVGLVDVTVDPAARRQGLGRHLFDAGVERVRAAGRRLVVVESFDTDASTGFAKAQGLDRCAEEVQRRLDVRAVDWSRLAPAVAAAEGSAAAYELVRLPGPVPDALLADVVRLTAVINDSPVDGLDVEDEVFSAERVRAFEAGQAAMGRQVYRLVARERATGALAGHTFLGVDADRPWWASQYDTSVARQHRGARLGLLLKTAMLRWLAEEEPQLRAVDTWNAASNAHMIRVNELLGCRVVATATAWQRHLDGPG